MAQTRGDHTLTGQVIGKQYQQPIPGANIYLEERPGGAVTNAQGGFTLTGLQSGSYTLHVSHIGYQRYSKKVQIRAGVKNHIMVYLADTVYQSDPVEIRTVTVRETVNLTGYQRLPPGTSGWHPHSAPIN